VQVGSLGNYSVLSLALPHRMATMVAPTLLAGLNGAFLVILAILLQLAAQQSNEPHS
jgi:hypothetical protein